MRRQHTGGTRRATAQNQRWGIRRLSRAKWRCGGDAPAVGRWGRTSQARRRGGRYRKVATLTNGKERDIAKSIRPSRLRGGGYDHNRGREIGREQRHTLFVGGKPSPCPSGRQFFLVRFHGENYPASAGVLVPPVFGQGAGRAFPTDCSIADGGVDRSLSETAPGRHVCAFESVRGQRRRVLQYDWGRRQAPHLSIGRRNVARTRGAARSDPVNCGTYWTDRLYPFLEALDLPGTEHRTQSGRNDASVSSPLGSFLCSDAKHRLIYVAPTLSFVCDSDSAPIGPPYVDRSLSETARGDACAFELFRGGGCFLFCDCCLSSQHNPAFIARLIVQVAEMVAAGL